MIQRKMAFSRKTPLEKRKISHEYGTTVQKQVVSKTQRVRKSITPVRYPERIVDDLSPQKIEEKKPKTLNLVELKMSKLASNNYSNSKRYPTPLGFSDYNNSGRLVQKSIKTTPQNPYEATNNKSIMLQNSSKVISSAEPSPPSTIEIDQDEALQKHLREWLMPENRQTLTRYLNQLSQSGNISKQFFDRQIDFVLRQVQ